ncbi:MAG: penicillin-binding protein activator [Bdellovibrionales bacterium]|nr:penicillin-binding protein activator [Bdellovibrionales bacterium]
MEPTKPYNILAFLVFVVFACAKPPTTILRGGVEMPVEQAAKYDYEKAESLFVKNRLNQAFPLYQDIANQFSATNYADNSLFRMAQIYQKQNQQREALKTLEKLVGNYPTGDIIHIAKYQLGILYYAQKDFRSAAEILASIPIAEIPDQSRKFNLESIASDSFDKANLPAEKLRWLIALYDQKQGTHQQKDAGEKVVRQLDFLQDPKALEQIVRSRVDKFPEAVASFKLAKLYFQSGDTNGAKRWTSYYIERFPNQDYYNEARQLYEILNSDFEVDPLAIGVLLPLEGPYKAYAEQIQRGLSLAPLQNIKIFVENVGDSQQVTEQAVHRLIRENKVIAIIGPLSSKTSQAAANAALPYRVPIIVWSAAEGITSLGDNVFRNSLTKSEQSVGLGYLAYEVLHVRRAAILYPQNAYGTEFMEMFWKEFVSRGGEVRRIGSYDPQKNNIAASIKMLLGLKGKSRVPEENQSEVCSLEDARDRAKNMASNPQIKPCHTNERYSPVLDFEAIFIPDGAKKAGEIIPTLAYYDVKGIQLLGPNLWNSQDIFRGKNESSIQGAMFLDGGFKSKNNPTAVAFLQRYQQAFQSEPSSLEAQAYDTALIISYVISNARPRSRSAFQKALLNIKNFEATIGRISILSNREAQHKLTPFIVDGTVIRELQ